jgi:ABC-type uncharacterized transport system permease subunit
LKGRANDPLLHASWYTLEQHSAVPIVAISAILGSLLVYLLLRRNIRRWWSFLLAGSATAMFPGLFYLVAGPHNDENLVTAVALTVVGLVWGALIGLVIYIVFRKPASPDPNQREAPP